MAFHLTRRQRHYLLFKHLLPAVLVNFLINFSLGWLFFHPHDQVFLWETLSFKKLPSSISIDLIPTTFFLVLFTSLIVSRQVGCHMDKGRVAPLADASWLARIRPLHTPMASLGAATALTLVLVPATVAVFHFKGMEWLLLWQFIWFKSIYASALAALFTPLVVLRAMAVSAD